MEYYTFAINFQLDNMVDPEWEYGVIAGKDLSDVVGVLEMRFNHCIIELNVRPMFEDDYIMLSAEEYEHFVNRGEEN